MKSYSINDERLLALCRRIRTLNDLTSTEKRSILETILKEMDVLRVTQVEALLCPKCAMKARGWKNHSSIYRAIARDYSLHVFKVCCRDFFDKEEMVRKPKVREWRGKSEEEVKVGMK